MSLDALDLLFALAGVAGAAGFLAWRLSGRGAAPACHVTGAPLAPTPGGDVVVGGALQRGIDRARARAQK